MCCHCSNAAVKMPLVFKLLCLCVLKMGVFSASVTQASVQSDVQCYDWGVWSEGSVRVYDGEVAYLYCPLFSHPTLYSYSQTQNSSLSLLWYRHTRTHELEQPINLKLHTLHKDREYLWIQPATTQDAGLYICMLR
ncbi:interleukin-1 receptor accessory -like protein [Labeo rohita]|uniref:Interleukin-1 receptor accessory-like protein n=1 Tax=Labeo rohita TaxID=84645 RepID=A0A498NH02_LABRO|nr:interleukin-1 receptor accessory -like protein [Labeo rohita]